MERKGERRSNRKRAEEEKAFKMAGEDVGSLLLGDERSAVLLFSSQEFPGFQTPGYSWNQSHIPR